jgi:hypothetical protein
MSRPAAHAFASANLGAQIVRAFGRGAGGTGGWILLPRVDLDLHAHGERAPAIPEWAGWREERMPVVPESSAIELAPDWVCEVTADQVERTKKMALYARERVGHLWLCNPTIRVLEVYRLDGTDWSFVGAFAGPKAMPVPPFEAVPFEPGRLWDRGSS